METKFLLPILLLSLISTPCLSETMGDLVKRDGIYYKEFTKIPFTGEITGEVQGNYKNGKKEGEWVDYRKDGTVNSERSGTFKNGKKVSD